MEPQCSSLCSQKDSTGPYPEPDESSYTLKPCFLKIHLTIYPPTHACAFITVFGSHYSKHTSLYKPCDISVGE